MDSTFSLDWNEFCASINTAAIEDNIDDFLRQFEGKSFESFGVIVDVIITDVYKSIGINIGKHEFTDTNSNILVFNYASLKPLASNIGDWVNMRAGDIVYFKGNFRSNPMRRFIELRLYPDNRYYAEITISDAVPLRVENSDVERASIA